MNRLICFLLLISLAAIGLNPLVAIAQSLTWSLPQRIAGYEDESSSPYLIADQNKIVHAFNTDNVDGMVAVTYSQWTLEQGWTEPIDVLMLPNQMSLHLVSVFLDQAGVVHIICFGGNEINANIYYAQAPIENAGQAPAWSPALMIGKAAIMPVTGAIWGDELGNLAVVYSGNLDGNGLYAVYSSDGGGSWSDALPIFLTYRSDLRPFALQTYLDDQGQLHAVWSTANSTGRSETVYYASKDNFYHPWTEPIELAQAIVYEADTPAIIKHQDELIVIYHNDFPTTRWMRRSFNGGQTWTEPAPAFPGYVGSNGAVSFARDSSNRLHVFFGNRNADATVNGMWHSLWQGGNWSNPQPVVSRITARRDQKDQGEVQDQGYMDGARRDPSFANAVVSQGNTILLTWTTDPGSDRNGVWYSYVTLDAPELPIVARPTPTSTSTPTPVPVAETPTSTPTDTPMPRQVNQFDEVPVDSPNSSATVLTLSLIPVTLLILGVVLFYVRRT